MRSEPRRITSGEFPAGVAERDYLERMRAAYPIHPELFDRLYQARTSVAPAGSEGGKGLGLAIVKRIAELHEGQVTVDSVPGQGSARERVRVPAAGPGAAAGTGPM